MLIYTKKIFKGLLNQSIEIDILQSDWEYVSVQVKCNPSVCTQKNAKFQP